MKNKHSISFVSVIMAILFCCNCVFFSELSVNAKEPNSQKKISASLESSLEKIDDNDEIKIAVWLYDIEEDVKNMAFSDYLKREFDKGSISSELYSVSDILQNGTISKRNQLSMEEIQTLLSIKRSAYKQLHYERNLQWKNNIVKQLNTYKLIYLSKYTPAVFLEVPKLEIKTLASSDEVEYVYLYEDAKVPYDNVLENDSIKISPKSVNYGVWQTITNINTMKNAFGLTGNGVKIGLLENGIPDINHSSGVFNNSNITPVNNGSTDGHATYMASILVGKTTDYSGVAPNAHLYCACYDYEYDYIGPMETLIDNNINILSISLGLGYGTFNTYGNYSKYLDYLVYNYNITVCMCSGNHSTSFGVPEGAMGYNLITVGNLDDNNTTTNEDDVIRYTSSYVTSSTEAYKPDLCAPGARVGTPSTLEHVSDGLGGTSAATPVVAGICAMLMQSDPSLMTKPMLLKSAIMSGAKRIPNMGLITSSSTSVNPAISRSYGSGLVNAYNTYNIIDSEKWKYIPLIAQEQNQNPYVLNVNISQSAINSSKKLAVCLTWTQKVMATSLYSSTVYDVYHHDLRVYDPNNNLVARSNYQYDRKQFVYYQPTVAGTYKIKVYKSGTSQAGSLAAISYNFYN